MIFEINELGSKRFVEKKSNPKKIRTNLHKHLRNAIISKSKL